MHQLMAATLDAVFDEIRAIQTRPASNGFTRAPALADDHPAHAQGLDRAEGGRRHKVEGTWRAHQVPLGDMAPSLSTSQILERMDAELPARGAVRRQRQAAAPRLRRWLRKGDRRMGANPHANGGLLLRDLRMPDFRDYAVEVPQPGSASMPKRPACMGNSCAT